MNKRSQIGLFIVLMAIIVISFTGIIFFSQPNEIPLKNQENPQLRVDVHDYIENCMELGVRNEIEKISLSGGYYETPTLYTFDFYTTVPLYNYYNDSYIPELKFIEEQLELALDNTLNFCIKDLNFFNESYGSIQTQDMNSEIEFLDDSVRFTLDYPVTLEQNGKIISLKQFEVKENTQFVKSHNIVKDFVALHKESFSSMPMSSLNELALNNDFTYEIKPKGDTIAVYSFSFENDLEEEIIYQFAIEYDWRFEE